MNVAYFTPENFLVPVALSMAHEVVINPASTEGFDAILLMSVSQMQRLADAGGPRDIPLFTYNWDVYDWSLKTPRKDEYDWEAFKSLCLASKESWVPSVAEQIRHRAWAGQEAYVVKSAVPYWTLPDIVPTDGRFVLDTLRETPDPFWGLAKQACDEMGIPLVIPAHKRKFEDYARLLATCTMSISTLREASTGGLGLVEAAWYGKPCLVPDNPENAGGEYVPAAYRFAAGDVEDLKAAIKLLWDSTVTFEVEPVRKDIVKAYSAQAMAKAIDRRLAACL